MYIGATEENTDVYGLTASSPKLYTQLLVSGFLTYQLAASNVWKSARSQLPQVRIFSTLQLDDVLCEALRQIQVGNGSHSSARFCFELKRKFELTFAL